MRSLRLAAMLVILTNTALARLTAGDAVSYVYARDGRARVIDSGSFPIEELHRLVGRWEGEYLWARIKGTEYLIRDPATLSSVARLFAPIEALDPAHHALTRRRGPLEARAQKIVSILEEYGDDERLRSDSRARQLDNELRVISGELRQLDAEEQRLDQQQGLLEKEAQKHLRKIVARTIEQGVAVLVKRASG